MWRIFDKDWKWVLQGNDLGLWVNICIWATWIGYVDPLKYCGTNGYLCSFTLTIEFATHYGIESSIGEVSTIAQ